MDSKPKQKIFIVDDDTFLLNMYSLKFAKNGFEVMTSQDGQDALIKLKSGFTPDIVLIDIIMPGLDGLDLLKEIRTNKLIPKATVIMLTNQSDAADIEQAKSLDINGYIVKATSIPSEVIAEVIRMSEPVNRP